MKIKKKIILMHLRNIICLTIIAILSFYFFYLKYTTYKNEIDIEQSYNIINKMVDNEINNMNNIILDWSHWDDTYNYINNKNQNYVESNLKYSTLDMLNLQMLIIIDSNNNILNILQSNNLNKIISDELIKKSIINTNSDLNGLLMIHDQTFIISKSKIMNSNETLKSNGTIIFIRKIDQILIKNVNDITGINLKFLNLENNKLDTNIYKTNNYIITERPLTNINNENVIGINITLNENNNEIKYYSIILLIFLIILISLINLLLAKEIDKSILQKLYTLNNFLKNIIKTKNMESKILFSEKDEFLELANSLNTLLYEINLADEEIKFLSYSDGLTALKNRHYMELKFEELDKNKNSNYFIIMGDVNGLKLANDALGHKEGDKLLLIISNILKQNCADNDIICRWGGDEFIILINGKNEDYVMNLISNIQNSCEMVKDFHFKVSIGLGYAKKDNENINTGMVMKLAEDKMYRNKLMESNSSRSSIISSLMQTLNEKHSETEEHTLRISELGLELGKELGLPQDKLDELNLLSVLHDIGKIGIPEQILMKPAKLDSDEWEIMKTHSDIGYRIVKATPELAHIADELLAHHEKYDGTGYPNGLKGENIPLISRIINVVDSFDAITNKRIYKEASSVDDAIKELKRCSGTQFDPNILNTFIKIVIDKYNNSKKL